MNETEAGEISRRSFLRSASLGVVTSAVAGSFPAISFGSQQDKGLELNVGSDPGCFSIRFGSLRLIENVHWKIEFEGETIHSTGGRYHVRSAGKEMYFADTHGVCDVRFGWKTEEEGSLLALSFSALNTSGKDLRIKNIFPLMTGTESGSGLYFWQPDTAQNVLTDEWERCYGLAGVQNAGRAVTIQSAWDMHLFDSAKDLACTLSYFQIPNSKMSITIGGTDQQRSSMSVRCDTHSGRRGVLLRDRVRFELSEIMVRMHHGSCFSALETYARLVARRNNVPPPPVIPVGWVDWYFSKARTTEDDVLKNLDFIARELKEFGLEYIQIDSGWQLGVETTPPPHNVIAGGPWMPNSKFPHGMKWFAEEIRKRGLKPGLWVRPFHSIDGSPERVKHPDWFNEQGQMDFSHPGVRSAAGDIISLLTNEWGFEYIKYDFPSFDLFGAWGPTLFEDHSAHAETHNPEETNITAYRNALAGMSGAAKGKAHLLACNSVMPATIGEAQVFRIGDDVGDWERTFRYGVKSVSARYYANGVFWTNDPDCLLVREPFTLDQARMWASLIALSGGAVFISEYLPNLPLERLDIIKKAIPVYRNDRTGYPFGRPLDLLTSNPASCWDFEVHRSFASWHVVGLFNWTEQEATQTLRFGELHFDEKMQFHLVDFWNNRYLGRHWGSYSVSLSPMSCQIVAIHKAIDRPQIVSTSRHILQGAVEIRTSSWNESASVLKGINHVIRNNPYELVVFAGDRRVREVYNTALIEEKEPGIIRCRLSAETTKDLEWSIEFNPG